MRLLSGCFYDRVLREVVGVAGRGESFLFWTCEVKTRWPWTSE